MPKFFHLDNWWIKLEQNHWAYWRRRPRSSLSLCRIGPGGQMMVAWAVFWSPTCDWKAFSSCCWSSALNWRAEAGLSSSFAFLAVRSDFLASAASISGMLEYISLPCSSCSVDFNWNHHISHSLIRCRYKFTASAENSLSLYEDTITRTTAKNSVAVRAWWDLEQWLSIHWSEIRSVDLELYIIFDSSLLHITALQT